MYAVSPRTGANGKETFEHKHLNIWQLAGLYCTRLYKVCMYACARICTHAGLAFFFFSMAPAPEVTLRLIERAARLALKMHVSGHCYNIYYGLCTVINKHQEEARERGAMR
jgi:hypothetical protein